MKRECIDEPVVLVVDLDSELAEWKARAQLQQLLCGVVRTILATRRLSRGPIGGNAAHHRLHRSRRTYVGGTCSGSPVW